MAKKDGLSIRLEGGAKLDRVLAKMAITHQSEASKIVYSALGSGGTIVKNAAKAKAPTGKTGELRNSLKSGLKRRVKTPRNVFLASVSFEFKRIKNENEGTGGWYSIFNVRGTKYQHPNNFMLKAVRSSEGKVRRKIGTRLAIKIAKEQQKQIDKLK